MKRLYLICAILKQLEKIEFYTIEFAQSDHFSECFGLVEKIDLRNSDDLL